MRKVLNAGMVLAFAVSSATGAWAQGADGNIFSTPQTQMQAPSYADQQGIGNLRRRVGNDVPGWKQVKSIPSLTAQQRREIHDIYSKARQELQPMMQQLKEMRGKAGGGKKLARARGGAEDGEERGLSPRVQVPAISPETRQSMRELRQKLIAVRKQTWEQVKSKLSSNQIKELEQMRKGELRTGAMTGS